MSEDFEIVDNEEERVEDEIVDDEMEISVDAEEVIEINEKEEEWERPPTLLLWLAKLERLRRILREELKAAKGLEEKAIADSLREVEREIKLIKCWLEQGKPCKGSKEPWRVYQLLKRYKLL